MPSLTDNNVKVHISTDADTSGITRTDQALGGLNGQAERSVGFVDRLSQKFAPLAGITTGAGLALGGLTGFMGSSIGAANDLNGALTGLNSIARAFGSDAGAAKQAAQNLASDGLMTVADAATGLKNLLATGFSLPQAVDIMNRFKDSAAFGKQSALGFGEAVRGATEGIKNGNSILTDNAGMTKNLSVILREMGKSEQDVMNITSDATVRQALYAGIMKETAAQVGDAARLSDSFAGAQARQAAQTKILQQEMGFAIQAALLPLLQIMTPIIQRISDWISHNQKLVAAIAIGITIFLGMIAIIGVLAVAVIAVGAVFAGFSALAVGVAVAVGAALAFAAGFIIANWNSVKNFFASLPGWIGNVLRALPGIVMGIFSMMSGNVLGMVRGLVDGIVNLLGDLPRRAANAVGNVGGKIADQIKGAFRSLKIPGFATGVQNFGGGLALVGERGPELVSLPRGSQVHTNAQSERMAGGGQGGPTYNIAKVELSTEAAVRAFFAIDDRNGVRASKGLATARF